MLYWCLATCLQHVVIIRTVFCALTDQANELFTYLVLLLYSLGIKICLPRNGASAHFLDAYVILQGGSCCAVESCCEGRWFAPLKMTTSDEARCCRRSYISVRGGEYSVPYPWWHLGFQWTGNVHRDYGMGRGNNTKRILTLGCWTWSVVDEDFRVKTLFACMLFAYNS